MLDVNAIRDMIETMTERTDALRGYLDYTERKERLAEVELELSEPGVWDDPEKAQALGRERAALEDVVRVVDRLDSGLKDAADLFELAAAEDDAETLTAIREDLTALDRDLSRLEFHRMFSGEMDGSDCFVEIQAGSGGTEAQDWAEMLLRMYLRWAERRGFETEIIEISEGEVAGIKGATFAMRGDHAYGWIRTETGIHRLVRKSPFDSGARRHTSFASVFVAPQIDDEIEVDINPSDVRTDTYRAAGAGGQHVNKTDSAVRLTHVPTGVVVQCQSERSQHQNRDKAWKQLRAKLYELELQKRRSEAQEIEDAKSDIGWGHQIRSYVLDQSRVKDLRTGVEISSPDTVLDGDIDEFIEASLKAAL
ncbi:MAG: peptide chain release factor 2 [Gammaproteobacteria bacterium]|nr:MAG: peptide chain release factor 2 [Gammaproteobacteria bacterium]